jgi:hypothetical protein
MGRMAVYASGASVAAAGLLTVMLAIAIQSGGVTQQRFELFAAPEAYMAAFSAVEPVILHTLIFDNLFIIAYVSALALGLSALTTPETRVPAGLAIAGIAGLGVLDYAENLHFITMYARLNSGQALSADEIGWRMWASMMKWHLGYLSLALASFVIPVRGAASFVLVWSLRVVLPVVGVLIYAGPEAWRPMLGIARYGAMLSGFILFAMVFAGERSERAA